MSPSANRDAGPPQVRRRKAGRYLGAKAITIQPGAVASSPHPAADWFLACVLCPPVLVRAEGEYRFPDDYRRVQGHNHVGLWVDTKEGSTGLLRPLQGHRA